MHRWAISSIVHGHRLGEVQPDGRDPRRSSEAAEHEHYRVHWEDGHESVFTPGSDALIRHVERSADDEPVLIHEP